MVDCDPCKNEGERTKAVYVIPPTGPAVCKAHMARMLTTKKAGSYGT